MPPRKHRPSPVTMAKTKNLRRPLEAHPHEPSIPNSSPPTISKKNKVTKMPPKKKKHPSRTLTYRNSGSGHELTDPIDLDGYKFYQSNIGGTTVPPVQHNLNKLFDQYRARSTPDKIDIEGAQRYLNDLSVDLDEVAHLALCELLQCPSIGEFDREPFISGWRTLSPTSTLAPAQTYDTIPRQSAHINVLRRRLATDPAYFKQVYRNAFRLAKAENQKSVPPDNAAEFWDMFFRKGKGGIEWNSAKTPWLDLWLKFYGENNPRPVNKDLWNMVGELVMKTREPDGESLEWWTEDGAWPMAVDEFVASVKEKRGPAGGDSMDVS